MSENRNHAHHKINYLEFPCSNFQATQKFFADLFGWTYVEYSPKYFAVESASIDVGFYSSDLSNNTDNGSALIIFYSNNLEETLERVTQLGGKINCEIFSFPGGRRFHFIEPSGNEFGVWSEN